MTAAVVQPRVTPADRLGMTFCMAIMVHAMMLLGVSFAPEPPPQSVFNAMEVILVNQRSDEAPDDAEILAQENLAGGGDSEQLERPSAPLTAPLPAPQPDVAAAPVPRVEQVVPIQRDSADAPTDTAVPEPQRDSGDTPTQQPPLLTAAAEDSPQTAAAANSKPSAVAEVAAQLEARLPEPELQEKALPSAAELITSSFALASLNAELQHRLAARSQRPRHKYISASTREYRYAAYMEAWRAKVERVGNLNYPDEARRRNLTGSLLLDVALNPDGSVREITVRKSSGHKVLDDAAVRIVELAAPFAPFPEGIAKEVDILHVTRTWQFLNSSGFASR